MKILIINKSDSKGGAAVVSRRLMDALSEQGASVSMLVTDRTPDATADVALAAAPWRMKIPFLSERLGIFAANGFDRGTLFRIDNGAAGLPLHRHPLVREADVIMLNWVNQGMLSLRGVAEICRLGKPVIWTMHDMWNFTGICHHAGSCRGYMRECGNCALLGRRSRPGDMSRVTLRRKEAVYAESTISFVAVSQWLAAKARQSTLLAERPVSVIPNAFPLHHGLPDRDRCHREFDQGGAPARKRILFGAARIDDPIKDFATAAEATRVLAARYPEIAAGVELVTYGSVANPAVFNDIAIPHRHVGVTRGEENLRRLYGAADVVLSTSVYETLPGTLVEGQAYGCIPVAFESGGQRDIVEHMRTGFLARRSGDLAGRAENIAEGLAWALLQEENAGIRTAMRQHVADVFSYPAVAGKYLRLIESMRD